MLDKAVFTGTYYTGSFYDVPLTGAVVWMLATALTARELDLKADTPRTDGRWRTILPQMAFLASRTLGFKLTNDDLERAAIASYNAGEGRVLKAIEQGRNVDSVTAHGDYAAAVLRYADLYLNLEA